MLNLKQRPEKGPIPATERAVDEEQDLALTQPFAVGCGAVTEGELWEFARGGGAKRVGGGADVFTLPFGKGNNNICLL